MSSPKRTGVKARARTPKPKTVAQMTRGERVIAFIETYCLVPEGKDVGKPIVLEPFQRKFILDVYDNPHGTSRAYLSIARKNGKTALIAGICLAHILGPEAVLNSQIISGARSRDQAALVFKLMVKMIALSDKLRPLARIIPSSKTIMGVARNVEYRAISAEGKTAHGLSPILAILDEVGQVRGPTDEFVEAIETAQGAHDAPMLFAISTQAPNDADMFSLWLDDAKDSKDPKIVSHVYEAPIEADLDDREAWLMANPAIGKFRSTADMEALATKAIRMPSFESAFRNLNLNQRVSATAPFVSRAVWEAGNTGVGQAPVDVKDLGKDVFTLHPVWGGLDLSARTDLTAFVLICFDGLLWHVRCWFWTPEGTMVERAKRDRTPYDVWAKKGYIKPVPGVSINYDYVAKDIAEIVKDMDLRGIGFDRWRMDVLKKAFERIEAELPLEPFGQGFKDMSPALDFLEEKLLNRIVFHGGNPVLRMCASNAVVERDAAENRKFTKAKATGRIDGLVAMATAFGMVAKPEQESDSHGEVVQTLE